MKDLSQIKNDERIWVYVLCNNGEIIEREVCAVWISKKGINFSNYRKLNGWSMASDTQIHCEERDIYSKMYYRDLPANEQEILKNRTLWLSERNKVLAAELFYKHIEKQFKKEEQKFNQILDLKEGLERNWPV